MTIEMLKRRNETKENWDARIFIVGIALEKELDLASKSSHLA